MNEYQFNLNQLNRLKEARVLLNEVQLGIPVYLEVYKRLDEMIQEIEDLLGIRR